MKHYLGLYRGISVEEKKWIYGNLGTPECDLKYSITENGDGTCNDEIFCESVGMSSGFVDKNGRLVFSGDKIMFTLCSTTGVVLFSNGCFQIKFDLGRFVPSCLWEQYKQIVVTGTIHDPLLITDEKEKS